MVLLLLRLAEGDVLLCCLLVEASAAGGALYHLIGRLHDLLLLPGRLVIFVSGLLQAGPQLQGLRLPFRHLFSRLFLLKLLIDHLSSLYQLLLLVCDDPLVLRVELFSLLLEDLPADCFVLADAVGVELPPAALAALNEFGGIVLFDLDSILAIDLFDVSLLEAISSALLPIVLLWLLSLLWLPLLWLLSLLLLSLWWLSLRWLSLWRLSLRWLPLLLLPLRRFLVILIADRLILLITPLALIIILRIVLLHLIVHILVRPSLVASSPIPLRWVIIGVLILIGRKF